VNTQGDLRTQSGNRLTSKRPAWKSSRSKTRLQQRYGQIIPQFDPGWLAVKDRTEPSPFTLELMDELLGMEMMTHDPASAKERQH
jgi:hypothetical protein